MFAANTYSIRPASQDDTDTLRSLAERNGREPLTGAALIGTTPAGGVAAISLQDGRTIGDPHTDHLLANLRTRAAAAAAYEVTHSTRDRMLAGMPAWLQAVSTPVSQPATGDTEQQPAFATA
jgi:hypothetical protein